MFQITCSFINFIMVKKKKIYITKSIQKNGFIAFEANETFFVNQKETIAYANQNNISIVSVKL